MASAAGKAPTGTVIYHNPKCTTSCKTLELLRDSGFVVTPKGTRVARPVDTVREIL
jgi:hypothetical protein